MVGTRRCRQKYEWVRNDSSMDQANIQGHWMCNKWWLISWLGIPEVDKLINVKRPRVLYVKYQFGSSQIKLPIRITQNDIYHISHAHAIGYTTYDWNNIQARKIDIAKAATKPTKFKVLRIVKHSKNNNSIASMLLESTDVVHLQDKAVSKCATKYFFE